MWNSQLVYAALGTNRFPYAADVSDSCVALASGVLIGLWDPSDPNDRGISATLVGHKHLVTSICFISEKCLASGDEKGTLILWEKTEESGWSISSTTQDHAAPITCVASLDPILATASSKTGVNIWNVESRGKPILMKNYSVPRNFPLSIALSRVPKTSNVYLVAVGGTDRLVHLWLNSKDGLSSSVQLAGHEDWVKSVTFRTPRQENEPLVLASGSNDSTIRLWTIQSHPQVESTPDQTKLSDDLLDAFEASLEEAAEGEDGGKQLSLKHHLLSLQEHKYDVTFDALLIGHEAGITRLCWRPPDGEDAMTLMSTSTDSSVIIWSPLPTSSSTDNSIWVNQQRFGDVGGQRLGGFVGGLWACKSRDVLAWGWSGGWRRWTLVSQTSWSEAGTITGHSGSVKTVAWTPKGDYLLSTGVDQTSRIHAAPQDRTHSPPSWHEVGRPQVHGYDMVGAEFLDDLSFVSIADEKVVRVFEGPLGFLATLEGLNISSFEPGQRQRPEAANVPPLGLSNKAVDEKNVGLVAASHLRRPFEGELAASTLWPEVEKIFGHGYESIALAVSHSGALVATACKSTSPEHAGIRLYSTKGWSNFGPPLVGHTLTVTRIAFSPDDRHLLSVSRDRSWRLFSREDDNSNYMADQHDKSHGRIIWDCSWSKSGEMFATASRDKTVKIWQKQQNWTALETIKTADAATAVAFSLHEERLLAVGLENGTISLYTQTDGGPWSSSWLSQTSHVAQVNRLSWRPSYHEEGLYLASCSDDGAIRVTLLKRTTLE